MSEKIIRDPAVGIRIRALRKARGLFTSDIGAAIGVSACSISNYENNRNGIRYSRLKKIAKFLEVPMSALIDSETICEKGRINGFNKYEKIGKNLKYAREKLGISEEELGKKIGREGHIIENFEKNRNRPSPEVIKLLADALDTTVEFLTLGKTEKDLEAEEMLTLPEPENKTCENIGIDKDNRMWIYAVLLKQWGENRGKEVKSSSDGLTIRLSNKFARIFSDSDFEELKKSIFDLIDKEIEQSAGELHAFTFNQNPDGRKIVNSLYQIRPRAEAAKEEV